MTLEEVIGRNIRKARQEAGWTRIELADRMTEWLDKPWVRQTQSAVELGHRSFTAKELLALAIVLDKPMGYFFHGGHVVMPSGKEVYTWTQ
jgi:transcriptional regulator with XRE-family HTH domain